MSMDRDCWTQFPAEKILRALTSLLFTLIVAAPLFSSLGLSLLADAIYIGFSPLCHQLGERSFMLLGNPWAVCQRCSGIYLGLVLGTLIPPVALGKLVSVDFRRYWAIGALTPLLLDAGLQVAGLWRGYPFSRFLTGMLFGAMVGSLLLRAVSEILSQASSRRHYRSRIHGGVT